MDGVLFNKDKTELICCPGGKSGSYTIPDSVTSIGNSAFYYCSSLESVVIPNSVTSIGERAFDCCSSLESIEIPDSVTSIGNYAFAWCSSLTSVTIGNSVTSIGNYAFTFCDSLTSVTIGNGVTSIGMCAFYNCSSLTSIVIPDSVTSIGSSAFYRCSSLADVYYSGSEEEWNNISINNALNANANLTNATIHYNSIGTAPPIVGALILKNAGATVSAPLSSVEYDSTMITVFYKNGAMVDIVETPISAGDESAEIPVTDADADTAKVFIWSSIDNMKPLCEAKSIEL